MFTHYDYILTIIRLLICFEAWESPTADLLKYSKKMYIKKKIICRDGEI